MSAVATIETFSDKARAVLFALLIHAAVVVLLLLGLLLVPKTAPPINLAGPVIEAELVGLTAAPKPSASRSKPAPPKPAVTPPKPPEPVPQPPTQVQRQDRVDKEKIAEMAQQKAEQAEKAQEEQRRQEQVLLEQEQQKARERAAELEKIKKELADAKHKKDLEKAKLEQMQDAEKHDQKVKQVAQNVPVAEKPVTGNNGSDNSQAAQYYAAIQNAVTNNWLRPDATQPGVRCRVRIVQIPGGDVIGVQISNPCNADPFTRTSIEQAVKRASPLPYKGYEQVFARDINLDFTYDG